MGMGRGNEVKEKLEKQKSAGKAHRESDLCARCDSIENVLHTDKTLNTHYTYAPLSGETWSGIFS